jgi:hypothetical protein
VTIASDILRAFIWYLNENKNFKIQNSQNIRVLQTGRPHLTDK